VSAQRGQGPRFYRTTKSAQKLVGEILTLLAEFGAESFHVQQKDGKPSAIAFQHAGIVFQMEPDFAGLAARLANSTRSDARSADARAVAWAQVRTLLEMQLEMVESRAMSAASMVPRTRLRGRSTSWGR